LLRGRVARVLAWLLAVPLAAYLAVLAWMFVYQRQLQYFPDRSRPQLAGLRQLGVREVSLRTADGLALLAWYLPPGEGRPVILYCHGNGGHIGYRADRVPPFAGARLGILLLEYRGYGGNPGRPSEAGLFADAAAALDFLRDQGVPPSRIVLYGESLGTGVAVHLAAQQQFGGLVLENPFTSVAAVAQYHYPFVPAAWLTRDRYDSLSRIGRVTAPILMLQGARDAVVPARFGRALFDAAPGPKQMWTAATAGHEDLARSGGLDATLAFIERHVH
jgi:uncharacterized protein